MNKLTKIVATALLSSTLVLPAVAAPNHNGNEPWTQQDNNKKPQQQKHDNHQSNNHKSSNGHKQSNAHPNENAYRNASPNASFKRGQDYRVVGKMDRADFNRAKVVSRDDDRGVVRVRTDDNQMLYVLASTLEIIAILNS